MKDAVTVMARMVRSDRPASLYVSEQGTGKMVWLPRSQIHVEEGGIVGDRTIADLGTVLRITMPKWLALEKGLSTMTDARQGELL